MKARFLAAIVIVGALWAEAPARKKNSAAAGSSKTTASAPAYQQLKFPPLKPVKIPEIATFTLSNGMKLYLLENHELPLVSGVALIRTGNLFDPADKVGLAEITGRVLRTGGTKSKTGDEIDVELENRAASVESSIGETSGTVSFNALKENTDEVLAIFRDLLMEPEFRQDKIDLVKTQLRGMIARRNDDAASIASREFTEILYGRDTPYGRRLEYVHLERITRADLIAFHQRYFFPANVFLAVQGDFDTPAMKAKLEELFGGWSAKQPPVPPFPPVTASAAPGIYLAPKPDINQAFIRMGHLGGTLRDKDYPALEVAADILGGSFSSRLFKKVRTELGYAYNIGAAWSAAYDHPGLFRISVSTKSASAVDTVKVIREEVERLRTQEVTDQELRTAKDTVLNSFVFRFDSPSKLLSRLLTYEYYGYPKDFLFQYQKGIESVTKADVLRVAKQYWKPEHFTIVAVANPAELNPPLTVLGEVKTIDLTIPEPKKQLAPASAASLEQGGKLLARTQQALGGADRLAAVRDMTQTVEISMTMGGNSMKAAQKVFWLAPSHLRQEQQLPFGKVIAYSDGVTGWLQTPQGVIPMPSPVVRQVQNELLRIWFSLALSDRNPNRTVNLAGNNTLEITDKTGASVRLQIDGASGMPLRLTYQSEQLAGAPVPVEEEFSDWREVNGVKLPFRVSITQGGKKFADAAVQEIRLNQGLKAEELSKKP